MNIISDLEDANCDLQFLNSLSVISNIKFSGKRSILRLTASFNLFVQLHKVLPNPDQSLFFVLVSGIFLILQFRPVTLIYILILCHISFFRLQKYKYINQVSQFALPNFIILMGNVFQNVLKPLQNFMNYISYPLLKKIFVVYWRRNFLRYSCEI
ncbi:MAG: hypothetical protein A2275_09890 [Bacteroidetes bacterium RIFOXYA12_FULL_35_11]|nr:MAG: hypothetical protein A2X01_03685 [Bacteroidetes bacterium GWF2_35_48]OFY82311.1 MAG: hypothetical protein A2275_09890 [Bacteroidetes bacterium RIFOXYA12_FULL_35_11]OFY96283.1 MAG: hypothetical protein A2491_06825 [Bacteroidetes bacterium RIFOXYC12_FULL_35_7]OFY97482.1 MAG: hypothetical protein A2309_06865 [Bacteroidetes bacterium RIFOXYB2_FULL_35_7]